MPALAKNLKVLVNGSAMEFPQNSTIRDLIQQLELDPLLVAVEQNREIVPKKDFATRPMRDGDIIEIVHFVGGG